MTQNNLQGEFILPSEKTNTREEQPTQSAPSTPETTTSTSANQTQGTNDEKHNKHPHSKPHFYSAFSYYPNGVKLHDQEEGEEVVILARQHFITNLPWVIGLFLLGLLPPLFLLFPVNFFPFINISSSLSFLLLLFYYLVLFTFGILYFAIWYFNVGVITNKRIIDLDVPNILVRVLSEARLNSIQDVTIIQVGGIRSFFNYGDVEIQTEALKQNLEFSRVPQPNFIRITIGNMIVHKK